MTENTAGRSRARCVVKPADWPATDQSAWQQILTPGDVLDPGGTGSHWAPATRAGCANAYGRWIQWLRDTGRLDPDSSPLDRVTPEALAAYVVDLRRSSASTSIVAYIAFLQSALVAMAPQRDWTWLRALVARLKRNSSPKRDKQPLLREPDDLVAFGEALMDEADTAVTAAGGTMTWESATRYRDGLMIATLALCPFRRKNFCNIRIGTNLVGHSDGGFTLAFGGAETKNRRPTGAVIPGVLVPALQRYLAVHRPFLCRLTGNRNPAIPFRPAGDYLWVSRTGAALSSEVFYKNLRKLTAARFGNSINPHLFRDCGATSVAINAPEQVGIVPGLLGHANTTTSERHYIHAQTVEAYHRHQQNVLALRRSAMKDKDVMA